MSTKKKKTTKTTATTKRSTAWNDYFKAAITGMTAQLSMLDLDNVADHDENTTITTDAARIVRTAEKIADIAEGRNA